MKKINIIFLFPLLVSLFATEKTFAIKRPFFKTKEQKSAQKDKDSEIIYLQDNQFSPNYPTRVSLSSPNLRVNVEQLNANYLSRLTEEEQQKFVRNLSKEKLIVEWVGNSGHTDNLTDGPKKVPNKRARVNAASALVLELMSENEKDLASAVLAQTDWRTTTPFYKGKAGVIFDPELTAKTIMKIVEKIDDGNIFEQIKSATSCVYTYIAHWSRGYAKRHEKAMNALIEKVQELNSNKLGIKQKGILLGVILSGTLNYSNAIKKKDEKRIYIVNSVTNLIWASTTLLGALPVGGNIVAFVGGGISLVVVGYDVFYNGIGVRDFSGEIRTIEGIIEIEVLKRVEKACPEQKIEALEMLKWMQSIIHFDGLGD